MSHFNNSTEHMTECKISTLACSRKWKKTENIVKNAYIVTFIVTVGPDLKPPKGYIM